MLFRSSLSISQPTPLQANLQVVSQVSCNGGNNGRAHITGLAGGTPGYNINWSPYGGTDTAASSLSAGNYLVTITDANGCTTSASTIINQPAPITSTITTNPAFCGGSTGSASVNASGGISPYNYLWNFNNNTLGSITGLTAGSYNVTITDANGCTIQSTAFVSGSPSITASAITNNNVSCFGGSNGSATVNKIGRAHV